MSGDFGVYVAAEVQMTVVWLTSSYKLIESFVERDISFHSILIRWAARL